MERDFEQEFRELKQSEIPDLWNRIEAGLSEKKNSTTMSQNIMAIDNKYIADVRKAENNVSGKEAPKKRFAWKTWGTLIAACLCVVIILPAFSMLIRNKGYSKGNMAESAAEDTAAGFAVREDAAAAEEPADDAPADEPADYGTAVESAENVFDGAADEGGAESAAAATEAESSASKNEAEAAETERNNAAADNAQGEETGTGAVNEEKAVWGGLTDGQILEEAVIQIQKAEDGIYQALVVQPDAAGLLESGTQIALVCDTDTAYDFPAEPREEKALKEEAEYTVNLRYNEKEGSFVVVTAGNRS